MCRMLEVRNHRIINIVPENLLVSNLVVRADLQYRIERVPDDEMTIDEKKELLVPCAHFSKVVHDALCFRKVNLDKCSCMYTLNVVKTCHV